jgi:hypothetical protein
MYENDDSPPRPPAGAGSPPAVETGRTLTGVIEDALRESLAGKRAKGKSSPVHLTTFGGTGLQPGVDLDDSADLLDVMEGPRAPARR